MTLSTDRKNYAGEIRSLRISRKWSQQTLAQKSGVPLTFIQAMERGAMGCDKSFIDKLWKAK
jgi:ribosome-binding protein aMBF1 (putative translation factor)